MKIVKKSLTGFLVLIFILTITSLSHAKAIPLSSIKVSTPPKLDGKGDDAAWAKAEGIEVEAEDGPEIEIRTVHTKDRVYFRMSWNDWTESIHGDKWVYNGSKWSVKQEKRWEDEPSWEADSDHFCFQWPLRDEVLVNKFAKKGCAVLCHKSERENKMFTDGPHEGSDIWQWRASTTNPLGYMDDGYLDHTILSKKDEKNANKRINAAHKWDELGKGGMTQKRNKKGKGPQWMAKTSTKEPFLIQGQETPINMSKIKKGDAIPGWLLAKPNGSRGDIDAVAKYDKAKGQWTLELSRKLVTDDPGHDVQFDDLSKTYHFGIAVWENDRLYGHARVEKPIALKFK